MIKIGIVTFHHVPNYGSVLQAYALAKYLNTLEGVSAEIIDYRPPAATHEFFKWHLKSPAVLPNLLKIYKFNRFVSKHLPMNGKTIIKRADLGNIAEDYDAFIAGSDQIWFPGGPRGFDETYYLSFAPPEAAFAYSASFGSMDAVDPAEQDKFRGNLKHFSRISVRDRNSMQIVEELTGTQPKLTCDPTFLWPFAEWLDKKTAAKKPYVLLFGRFWWLPRTFVDKVHQQGLKIISIGHFNPRADKRIYAADPAQWVQLVANAQAVLTTYFHGTVFALKFKRPFLAVAGGKSGKGPKHGGANIKVVQMVEDMKRNIGDWTDEDSVSDYLVKLLKKEAFDKKGLIYGMGHAVYSLSDPRANVFKGFVERLSKEKGRSDEFKLYALVEKLAPEIIAKERRIYKGVSANVDFYSGFVYSMLDLPQQLYTPLFAVARIAGWVAHRMEELVNGGKIIRPAYLAVSGHQKYIPLDKRSDK